MKKLFNGVFQGKTVLVTGHTGFKGSWLSLWLSELGARVVGYSLDVPTNPSHFELLKLDQISVTGDVLYKSLLLRTIEQYKPDIIFHLAAQPIVRKSYRNPVDTFEVNIIGTANILEASRLSGHPKAVVLITSDKCYQNNESIWGYREVDPMGGDDPYSASKGCTELIINSYMKSFFSPKEFKKTHNTLIASARAGNVIGGGDWAQERLIPDLIRATIQKKTTSIRNPQATRPWQHVLEPLSGYLQLGQKLLEGKAEFSGNWNFGPRAESNLTVIQIIGQAQKYWKDIKYSVKENPNNLHESDLLMLDSTKANRRLKWNPVWNKEKTLNKVILWYKNYYEKDRLDTSQNLSEYISDAKNASMEWTN